MLDSSTIALTQNMTRTQDALGLLNDVGNTHVMVMVGGTSGVLIDVVLLDELLNIQFEQDRHELNQKCEAKEPSG